MRNLLHKSKLEAFQKYIDHHPNLEWRDTSQLGNGYCVMQVHSRSGGWDNHWLGIWRRDKMPEHYTIDSRLEATVRAFLKESP